MDGILRGTGGTVVRKNRREDKGIGEGGLVDVFDGRRWDRGSPNQDLRDEKSKTYKNVPL